MTTLSLTSFPKFSELPFELRLKIWSYTFPGPRVLTIKCTKGDYQRGTRRVFFVSKYTSTTAPPIALSICQESRDEALRRYTLILATNSSPAAIPIDYSIDTIRIHDRDCRHLAEPEISLVQDLVIDVADYVMFGDYNMEEMLRFTALKRLVLMIGEIDVGRSWWGPDVQTKMSRDFTDARKRFQEWAMPEILVGGHGCGDKLLPVEIEIVEEEGFGANDAAIAASLHLHGLELED